LQCRPLMNTNETLNYWSLRHPSKFFDARCTTSCLKLWGHRSKSHQIYTRSTEM